MPSTPTRSLFATTPSLLRFCLGCCLGGVLAACTSAGDVTQLNRDTYMVTSQSRLGGNDGAAAAGVLKADAFCKERGKRMQLGSAETSDGVIGVWPSKSVVMFTCTG